MSKKFHLAGLLMVKDEERRIHVTLESLKDHVDSIVMYDTGSTDKTIEIAKDFCDTNNIPLRLKEGEFVDFATSRNVSLEFADTFEDIDFIILLDINDELQNGQELRKFLAQYVDKKNTGFLLCQEWWSGKHDKYYNVRLVKAHKGWRYRGRVHEWMKNTRYENDQAAQNDGDHVIRIPDTIKLYQDRTQDNNKSAPRFKRDKELLLQDHKDNHNDSRTIFYLAQTCGCLRQTEDAFYYYKLRTELEGFWEERFHAYYRVGECAEDLGLPWDEAFKWYMKAFEYSKRVEPMIKIAEHYFNEKNHFLAYHFSNMACDLDYPDECILFINQRHYTYTRYHLLSINAYYVKKYTEGKEACLKAIATGINKSVDEGNLKFYLDHEKGGDTTPKKVVTKNLFMVETIKRLKEEHPDLKPKQLRSKANRLWKAQRVN